MPVTELWLARHGESVANVAAAEAERGGALTLDIELRDADVPLSEAGAAQARALGAWWNEHHLEEVWVSPYLRARQTLQLAAHETEHQPRVRVDERLRDRELGILDLHTWRGVEALHPEEAARRKRLGKYYHRPPGGESWADLALRLRSVLRDLDEVTDGPAFIVAHDAVVMNIIGICLRWEEARLMSYAHEHPVPNTSVTTLVRDGEEWRIERFGDVRHLGREHAPVTEHEGTDEEQPDEG